MKIEELEYMEMRKRILKLKAQELFEEATKIWEKKVNYSKWSWWKKFWFVDVYCIKIKEIQMDLLEREVREAME